MKRRQFLAIGSAAFLAACSPQESHRKFNATDISGADWARGFDLTDHAGRRRTMADFKGKVVILFFGFTRCPDACPLALAEMAQVVARLGRDAERVQGLFITVDPERDTQEVLAKYVTAFHPTFLGLRGTRDETVRTATEFRIYYQADRKEGGDPQHYLVAHTTGIFMFDPQGRPRLHVGANERSVEKMAQDAKRLLFSAA